MPLTTRAQFVDAIGPLLDDAVRTVRTAAATRLAASANELANSASRDKLQAAIVEYKAAQSMHLDRAAAHTNLANLSLQLASAARDRQDLPGQQTAYREAVESLRNAIRLEPYLTGPSGLLAEVLEQIRAVPELSDLASEVGAAKTDIDRLRRAEADHLARDQSLLPLAPDPHYRRAMLMYLLEDLDEARREIDEACRLGPNDYDNWLARALICQKQQSWQEAVDALQQMRKLRPQDPTAIHLFQEMRQTMVDSGIEVQVVPRPKATETTSPTPLP